MITPDSCTRARLRAIDGTDAPADRPLRPPGRPSKIRRRCTQPVAWKRVARERRRSTATQRHKSVRKPSFSRKLGSDTSAPERINPRRCASLASRRAPQRTYAAGRSRLVPTFRRTAPCGPAARIVRTGVGLVRAFCEDTRYAHGNLKNLSQPFSCV